MLQVWTSFALAAGMALASQPVRVQYVQSLPSREVLVILDGGKLKKTNAGKLGFRDERGTWTSYCADVRAPVMRGDAFRVRPKRTSAAGGNYAKAGNILAKHFKAAQTADQCAGLQLAIWEAVEDGGPYADFSKGKFQVSASPQVVAFAATYYDAIELPAEAYLLIPEDASGQTQITTVN